MAGDEAIDQEDVALLIELLRKVETRMLEILGDRSALNGRLGMVWFQVWTNAHEVSV
jgi:hypothetical protein